MVTTKKTTTTKKCAAKKTTAKKAVEQPQHIGLVRNDSWLEPFEDAIRGAVSLGGDSDTQGAIAGAIAEAYYGIPDDLIEKAGKFIPDDVQKIIDWFYKRLKMNDTLARTHGYAIEDFEKLN